MNKNRNQIFVLIGGIVLFSLIIIALTVSTNKSAKYNLENPPTNNYTHPPDKKSTLTPEEIRIQNKKEAEERTKRDREESQKKYNEGLDDRQKEIDKMSKLDYYMYHGNPNNLSFEEFEKQRKQASEDYWKNKK